MRGNKFGKLRSLMGACIILCAGCDATIQDTKHDISSCLSQEEICCKAKYIDEQIKQYNQNEILCERKMREISEQEEQDRLCDLEKRAAHTLKIHSSPHRLEGKHSHYGHGDTFNGRKTARGEIYDAYAMTAAHVTLPIHTVVCVYAVSPDGVEKDSVVLRISDRGPYEPVIKDEYGKNIETPHYERVIDFSYGAHEKLFKKIAEETTLREEEAYTIRIEPLSYHKNREEAELALRNISGVTTDSLHLLLQDNTQIDHEKDSVKVENLIDTLNN